MALFLILLYSAAMLALFGFGLHSLAIVFKYHRLKPQDPTTPSFSVGDLPPVTIQLPVFNELHVARRLVSAVCAIEYPRELLQIQVLDDSDDETTELLGRLVAQRRGQGYEIDLLHRETRDGFKAGALRDALPSARGELIAIFDADFVPPSEFLLRTVPFLLRDPELGMVQARWEHLNRDHSMLTRVQALALDAHFAMEQQVRNRSRCFMNFNGTAGVWRRSCIEDSGNWQADTLTEDLDLSYRAQLRGWRFLYLNDLTVPAELPAEINGLKSQQFRWTKGAIETARKLLSTVWRSDQPLRVKLYATNHLTSNLVFPFILIIALLNVPMVLVKASDPLLSALLDVLGASLLVTLSTLLFYLSAQRDIRDDWVRRMAVFPLFMAGTMGMAVGNTRAVVEALLHRPSEFERTPKYAVVGTDAGLWRSSHYRRAAVRMDVAVELAMALYFVCAIAIALALGEYGVIPLQLLFLLGFGTTGLLSLRHARA